MSLKEMPFTKNDLEKIVLKFPTPFHIYDEKAIRENARDLLQAFEWNEGFKEYFAVKATPNPFILKVLKSEGFGTDCSSLPELLLSEKVGIVGSDIMFSSNDTPAIEFPKARQLNAIINLDDISHIPFLEKNGGIPEIISVRYNPGKLREGSFIMGSPENAKYGFTREQIFPGLSELRQKGARKFGVHTFIASNELNPDYFVDTADMLFDLALEIKAKLRILTGFVNISGGIGIPYQPDQKKVNLAYVGEGIRKKYQEKIRKNGLHPLSVFMECGRAITGPYGYLVSRVLHKKEIYKTHIGLDASMANLMRPGMYGAYHHITVAGKENHTHDHVYDVTGSLCESIDRFAVDRLLPEIEIGDLVVIHDTGAHGYAMGFNYNGKLRSSELLLREDGEVVEIRRAERVEDYFATLDFDELERFEVLK
ncbi:MAG: diaminopimelate decarboxylase [Syntrophus sp. RIFOXYC2_FULL_54_9]|nr:MAG: diaminopimelate decarboxylase [Syntrophus sp. RIFOXYC2_FULL_54_9]